MKKPDQPDLNELCDVEQLLGSMSLKSPSRSLNKKIASLDSPARWRRSNHLVVISAVAVIGIVGGFLLGRYSNIHSDGKQTAQSQDVASDKTSTFVESGRTRTNESAIRNASEVRLIDQGLFFLNGDIPVRKYRAITRQSVHVIDPSTGEPVEIEVPVQRAFVTSALGT